MFKIELSREPYLRAHQVNRLKLPRQTGASGDIFSCSVLGTGRLLGCAFALDGEAQQHVVTLATFVAKEF